MIPLADTGYIWLGATVVYLALQPAWDYLRRWAAGRTGQPGDWARALAASRAAPWLALAGRLAYCLGVPYLALLVGVADARRMGLVGLPGWPHLFVGTGAGLAGVGLLAWSWGQVAAVSYRRGSRRRLFAAEWQALGAPGGWVSFLAEIVSLQMSWAFVRGAAIRLAGLYAGVFLGLALLAATWLLRPGRLEGLAGPEERADAFLAGGLALLTSLVFLYAENLWLCGLVHALGLATATLAASRAYARA